jgi:1-acyl-sn-glycerol-3-phosphate acyltransferase
MIRALRRLLGGLLAQSVAGFMWLLTGAQARWIGCIPESQQRIYFANHTSHGDFVLIWTCLPPELRAKTRPVAGADYWLKGKLRRYVITDVLNGVLIDRDKTTRTRDPIETILAALDEGWSLIVFPEGTRNTSDDLLPFKSGIYHVARQRPGVQLIPVWIENLNRVMPKGEFLPVPLLCSATFGTPTTLRERENKDDFLARLRDTIRAMRPA